MDETEASVEVRRLLGELRKDKVIREDAERRIAGTRKFIEGHLEMFPLLESILTPGDLDDDDEDSDDEFRPRGMEAVLKLLQDHLYAGKWYTVPTILKFLEKKGWEPASSNPRNAVRAALERLVDAETIEKGKAQGSGAVIYRWPEDVPDDLGEEPF